MPVHKYSYIDKLNITLESFTNYHHGKVKVTADKYGIHPNMLSSWRAQLRSEDVAFNVFGNPKKTGSPVILDQSLQQRILKLSIENATLRNQLAAYRKSNTA